MAGFNAQCIARACRYHYWLRKGATNFQSKSDKHALRLENLLIPGNGQSYEFPFSVMYAFSSRTEFSYVAISLLSGHSQAEISKLAMTVLIHQSVAGFQVTVNAMIIPQ